MATGQTGEATADGIGLRRIGAAGDLHIVHITAGDGAAAIVTEQVSPAGWVLTVME